MVEVLFLAVALSMDAFAVSIGLGTKNNRKPASLALLAAVYFGIFQGLMPVAGFWAGKGILGWIEAFASWVASSLLVLIGGKMIYESFAEGIEEDLAKVTHRVMLTLAIATSIDAMAAGFALTLLDASPFIACAIIGAVTFMFSGLGVLIGARSGAWLESKAELLGGCVLILIGVKMLWV